MTERRHPIRVSFDNGSEFRSQTVDSCAANRGIARKFIQLWNPIQNSDVESFNCRFRDECPD